MAPNEAGGGLLQLAARQTWHASVLDCAVPNLDSEQGSTGHRCCRVQAPVPAVAAIKQCVAALLSPAQPFRIHTL